MEILKSKGLIIGSIGTVALLVGAVLYFFSPDATAAPSVGWNPSRVTETLHPRESRDVRVTVKALSATETMTTSVVPELQPYVTVTPTSIGPLAKDETATLTLSIAAPIDAQEGLVNGTVHLRQGLTKQTLAVPLSIQVSIICPCLPPDPGAAGKATLEGIDSDNDGVRDDIQRYIALTYPDSARTRAALSSVAREFQQGLVRVGQGDTTNVIEWHNGFSKSVDCLWYLLGGDDAIPARQALVTEFLNTKERSIAYVSIGDAVTGMSLGGAKPNDYNAGCSFNPDSLPN